MKNVRRFENNMVDLEDSEGIETCVSDINNTCNAFSIVLCAGHLQVDRLQKYTPSSAQQTSRIHNTRRMFVVKAGEYKILLNMVPVRLLDLMTRKELVASQCDGWC